jgi:hypothetical protein
MAFKLDNHVHMTTDTTGTTNDYELTPISGFRDFGDFMDGQDTTWYTCYDQEDPVNFESGVGRYDATNNALERLSVIQSTGGSFENWPSPGVRDIVCGVPSNVFVRPSASGSYGILNPDSPRGFAAKVNDPGTAQYPLWEFREMTSDDTSNIVIINPDGSSGHVRFNTARDLSDLLQKNGTAGPLTTMDSELILDSTVTRITGALDATNTPHSIRYGTGAQQLFDIYRRGAKDVELWAYEGGTAYRLISTDKVKDHQPSIFIDSTMFDESYGGSGPYSTMRDDHYVQISIPDDGYNDYTIRVTGIIGMYTNFNVNSIYGNGELHMSTTGAPTWTNVQTLSRTWHSYDYQRVVWFNYMTTSVASNTTYWFGYYLVNQIHNNLGGYPHTMEAIAFRPGQL